MPTTAFSNHFRRELDVGQLARLILWDTPEASEDHLSEAQRAWIRTDVRCSSCGVGGAQIVRATKSTGTRGGTRQAHFRFIGDDAMDAHHRFCEFHGADGQERQSEPPRVYRRVKYSKDEPYDEPEIHPCLSC